MLLFVYSKASSSSVVLIFLLLERSLFHLTLSRGLETVIIPYRGYTRWDWLAESAAISPSTIGGVGYWDFIPAQIPVAIRPGVDVSWKGSCFGSITASLSANSTGGTLTIKATEKRNPICTEFYDFGDRENAYLLNLAVRGTHTVGISEWLPYEYDDVVSQGMKAFLFPMNAPEVAASILLTTKVNTFHTEDTAERN